MVEIQVNIWINACFQKRSLGRVSERGVSKMIQGVNRRHISIMGKF